MNLAWIRRAASKNLAWTLAAAVAIVAIAAYAMMSRKKERMTLMQRFLADNGPRENRRRAASGCPYSFQTRGKDGKCRGCPPDRPVWDGRQCKMAGGA